MIPGITSFRSSSLLPPKSGERIDIPVTLLPGFAKLFTRPASTGSPTPVNTIGIVLVACLTATVPGVALSKNNFNFHLHELSRKLGQAVQFPLGVSDFEKKIFPFHIAEIA